jgi:hypothetical protein
LVFPHRTLAKNRFHLLFRSTEERRIPKSYSSDRHQFIEEFLLVAHDPKTAAANRAQVWLAAPAPPRIQSQA